MQSLMAFADCGILDSPRYFGTVFCLSNLVGAESATVRPGRALTDQGLEAGATRHREFL